MSEHDLPKNMYVRSKTPMHLVLLADDTKSLTGKPARQVTDAIQDWVRMLWLQTRGRKPYFLFSFIRFGSTASCLGEALDINDIRLDSLQVTGSSRQTHFAPALREAQRVIMRAAEPHHCPPFVFLYSDGVVHDGPDGLEAASHLKALRLPSTFPGVKFLTPRVVTLGFGDASDEYLRKIATSTNHYKRVHDAESLRHFLPNIGTPTDGGTVDAYDRSIQSSDAMAPQEDDLEDEIPNE